MYGPERGYIALVWPLACIPSSRNELIVWDLAEDRPNLLTLSAEQIRLRMYTRQDDLPKACAGCRSKTIHGNKVTGRDQPAETLSPAMAERWGIDATQAMAMPRLRWPTAPSCWRGSGQIFQRPSFTAADVDGDLYGGFLGNEDKRLLARLRQLSPEALAGKLCRRPGELADERLAELLFRYCARNFLPRSARPRRSAGNSTGRGA